MRSMLGGMNAGVRLAMVSTGALLIAPVAAYANEAEAQRNDTDTAAIDEIVVTAQHRSENIQNVPISIQAFTEEKLKDLGVKTTADIGQFTPNVSISLPTGAGNQPVITIRGIGLNDFNTNNAGPNGVYLDEVYLSSPSSQTLQMFDLERVEVLKGPQGTLYGRNTSGGAINLVSAKPSAEFNAKAHIEYSSFDTINTEAAVGGSLSSTLTARVAATWTNSDGYAHNVFKQRSENGSNSFAARGQLRWQPSSDLDTLLSVNFGRVKVRPTAYRHLGALDPTDPSVLCSLAATEGGQCIDIFGFGTPASFYDVATNSDKKLNVKDYSISLKNEYKLGSVDLVSITAFNRNKKFHPEDADSSPYRMLETEFGVRSSTFSQEFRLSQNVDSYHWVVGAYYLHEVLKQNQRAEVLLDLDTIFSAPGAGDGTAFLEYSQNRQKIDSGALFGQVEFNVTDSLKLIGGGRFTSERKKFDSLTAIQLQEGGQDNFGSLITIADESRKQTNSALSWRIGANYDLATDAMVYASAATGFKSGGFNGGFLTPDPAAALLQLEPVDPEKVTAYEIGLKSRFFDRKVTFNIAAFYNDYRDMQVYTLISANGLLVNVLDNADKAKTKGIDAELSVTPVTGLVLSAQLGLVKGTLTRFQSNRDPSLPDYSGNRLPLAPRQSMNLSANWEHPIGPGVAGLFLNANYRSSVYFDTSNNAYAAQKGYWLGNARLSYAIEDEKWEVAGFVRNIGNTKYYISRFDIRDPFGMVQGITGTPRSYGVELNYRF
jgi:iron complex outermembrane recepter protein